MIPLNYVLAVAVLTSPVEQTEPPTAPPEWCHLRGTMQSVALSWEIMDPREVRYILARGEDFATDVRILRRRYEDLWEAPSLDDAMRFPPRAVINDMLAFNRKYRSHLAGQKGVHHAFHGEMHQVLQETDRLYDIWDTVRDARCESYYVTVRRQALKKLRKMVGNKAYYSGDLPPHVPIWRFARID